LRAFVEASFAFMPPVEISEAPAPTAMAAEKARLFIIIIPLQSRIEMRPRLRTPQRYHAMHP
jgi:hypothetical protein